MDEFLKIVGISSTIAIASVGAILFLLKDTFIEFIKTELKKDSDTHLLKTKELHPKKLELIFETNKKMINISENLSAEINNYFVCPDDKILGRLLKIFDEANDFIAKFNREKIILNKDLSSNISEIFKKFSDLTAKFVTHKNYVEADKKEIRESARKSILSILKEINNKVPLTIEKIEKEFRKEIGV